MGREAALQLVEVVTDAWAADPESDVVWSGDHEGRRGVRMRQTVRDFTTVWFDTGERTVTVEAFVLPVPPHARTEVFRQALVRNAGTRRVHFALDRHGDLVVTGRIPPVDVWTSSSELDHLMVIDREYMRSYASISPVSAVLTPPPVLRTLRIGRPEVPERPEPSGEVRERIRRGSSGLPA
jgi:hypothetical protein